MSLSTFHSLTIIHFLMLKMDLAFLKSSERSLLLLVLLIYLSAELDNHMNWSMSHTTSVSCQIQLLPSAGYQLIHIQCVLKHTFHLS